MEIDTVITDIAQLVYAATIPKYTGQAYHKGNISHI